MSDSESRSNGGLGPERKGPAVEATVPPTAGEVLAEECARAICGYWDVGDVVVSSYKMVFRHAREDEVAERLKHILDAKDETRRE